MTSKGAIVGIDLGTTYSLVGALRGGRPVLFPNALGEHLTPSAVSVDDDGEILVGAPARARAATHPDLTALCFKRDMGTNRTIAIGSLRLRPEELSAAVLADLKSTAERALGEPVAEAVITVPAYFGDLQRQATRAAGEIAGLTVERIINEPTAAALAYGLHEIDREVRAIVLDLGGGTFDVTILQIAEGVIEIQSTAGDARLGGEDFVDALVVEMQRRIQRRFDLGLGSSLLTRARLRDACERAKLRLSEDETASVVLPELTLDRGQARDVEMELTRIDAEQCWQPVLHRLRGPVARAMGDAGLQARDVDTVLLVGGATRMPCFVREAVALFGRLPHRELPPDEAVAIGAAIQSALKVGDAAVQDLVVTDVAPFSLGIATAATMQGKDVGGFFKPILERGTVIPASRVERFYPVYDAQRELTVEVFQGEHPMCSGNTALGELTLRLPRGPTRDSKAVDVRFSYDLNGLLEVEMTIVATGTTHHLVIEQRPGALRAHEIAAAREAMRSLKFHPRDALPNRTALARGDALFAELTGGAREILGDAIAQLRVAIESQDPALIDPARGELLALIDRLRRR